MLVHDLKQHTQFYFVTGIKVLHIASKSLQCIQRFLLLDHQVNKSMNDKGRFIETTKSGEKLILTQLFKPKAISESKELQVIEIQSIHYNRDYPGRPTIMYINKHER